MNREFFFTTSWDDGSIHDLKLAEILAKYNIKGTFYIAIKNSERNDNLHPEHVRILSDSFEIGGHTYSHAVLTNIDDHTAEREILEGKKTLEDLTGKDIVSFCPPRGKFKKKHLGLIQNAGFKVVRTTGYLRIRKIVENYNNSLYFLHTTFQFYPHKPLVYVVSALKRRDIEGFSHICKNYHLTWYNFMKNVFDEVKLSGGVFHLWGHSWELEKYNLWDKLEDFLKYVRECGGFKALTNYEVVNEWRLV